MTQTLADKTILMSGGSRGIGLAIALRAARDGANVVMLAKTAVPHPKLEGTVHTAVDEIERAGGKGLAVVGDVRDEDDVRTAVDAAVSAFGGIDIVVNNASAIDLSSSEQLEMKRYDLMQDINTRGTFLLSKAAIPHLRKAGNPHILTLSPPLNLAPHWVEASRLHAVEVRHESVHHRARRGARRRRHRRQLVVAADPDRHGRSAQRGRRRRTSP
jgi:citronellol/citronellal dehydrogenase